MPPATLILRNLHDPAVLVDLAADANADGRKMVERLIDEWHDGSNRFDAPGEHAYIALVDDRIVGVCGLNVDPFAGDPTVGRIRRLYVAVAHRRQGIATAMVHKLETVARPQFRTLHLRTTSPPACAFYEALGFTRITGNPTCTHSLSLQPR